MTDPREDVEEIALLLGNRFHIMQNGLRTAIANALRAYGERVRAEALRDAEPVLVEAGRLVIGEISQCSDPGRHDAFCRCHASNVARHLIALVAAFQQIRSGCDADCTTGPEGGALHSVDHQCRLADPGPVRRALASRAEHSKRCTENADDPACPHPTCLAGGEP